MRVNLFGIGLKGHSPAIDAQRRINCYLEPQIDPDRTKLALVGSPGLTAFCTSIGNNPSRGLWAVNTLTTPLVFSVHGNTLYSINNAAIISSIGTINTSSGDVSMADDGTFLVLVDGTNGWVYNMGTGVLTKITDGNFTTTPKTVTWQDNYFIVTSSTNRQFQLSQISPGVDPTVWPAVQINFTGSGGGQIQAGIADHSVLELFGDVYTEFWQDAGNPDFPYANIPGSSQEFGLAAPGSLCKYDNSLAGLFKNKMGDVQVSRMAGFRLQKLSTHELDHNINDYTNTADCQAFAYMLKGNPLLQLGFPSAGATWEFSGLGQTWGERQDANGGRFRANKFTSFLNRKLVSDYRNGNIYEIDDSVFTYAGDILPMEVWSRHIWNDDKYISIPQLQVDVESGVGLTSGQGSIPQIMLDISKDGGQTFSAVSWSSMGAIGQYTQRVIWRRLGRARDWIIKLRITDPVKRVLTGASAEMVGGTF
jgi:hypothetical protein